MKRYITIDGGTSNTRISLIEDRKCLCTQRLSLGARDCIDRRAEYENEIKLTISKILNEFDLKESDIIRIIASGMITSEFGLYELPHLSAPAGIRELHESMAEVSFPHVSSIPFIFIRGIKLDSKNFDEVDMMRGEETELMGIIKLCSRDSVNNSIVILPGSHSKIVIIDKNGMITNFSTMLTGEMIMALSQGTILKDAVDLSLNSFDESTLAQGFLYAKEAGLNKALFKVRILKNIFKKSPIEVYSFYIGAILSDEIDHIIKAQAKSVIIGGKQQIKAAMAFLISRFSDKKVTVIDEESVSTSTSIGAIEIYEFH